MPYARKLSVLLFACILIGCTDATEPVFDDPTPDPQRQEIESVVFTDLPPDSLHYAHWNLIDAAIEEDVLAMHVGFSGCMPERPWTFYISGAFMESEPVQVNGVLVHELEDDCDAYWQTWLSFDLLPLRDAYIEAYGTGDILILNVIDFQGTSYPLEYLIDTATGVPFPAEP